MLMIFVGNISIVIENDSFLVFDKFMLINIVHDMFSIIILILLKIDSRFFFLIIIIIISRSSFLCPNGTIFNQQRLICDWWSVIMIIVDPWKNYPDNFDRICSSSNPIKPDQQKVQAESSRDLIWNR